LSLSGFAYCAVITVKAHETSGARSPVRLLSALCTRKALSVDLFFSLPETAGFFIGAPAARALATLAPRVKKPARGGFVIDQR